MYGGNADELVELDGYDGGVGNWLLYKGYGVLELPGYVVGGLEEATDDVGIEGYGSITFDPEPPYAMFNKN